MRKKRKTVSLVVQPDGEVIVGAPLHMPITAIDLFVANHKLWIARTQARFCADEDMIKTYHVGFLMYHGEAESWDGDAHTELYARAHELIAEFSAYAQKVGNSRFDKVSLSRSCTTWGSCTSTRHILLNYMLVCLPLELCEYVMAHELTHLTHMNHSPAFWASLTKIIPDAKARKARLRDKFAWLLRLYKQ